ncbi:hypothetical protein ACQCN2_16595 [Brevibacillus ginsengisoli]|uniref:hypothetical protein n=1 Tax=Brevibacillus ginsengisoli TaxID=363854 RepID=UPI003CEFB373
MLQRIGQICLQIMVVIVCTFSPASVSAEEKTWTVAFSQQINVWIKELSTADHQFDDWKGAKTSVQTLGPNSMQWLVTLSARDKQVGYMVVAEEKQRKEQQSPQFVLMEYGLGEFVLFNDTIAPRQKGALPIYDGFASYWKFDQNGLPQYVDAKTGEHYPSMFQPDKGIMETLSQEDLALAGFPLTKTSTLQQVETDPFDTIDWMQAQPIKTTETTPALWEHFANTTTKKSFVVTASLFQDEVLAPFTVGSVHVWGDKTLYIGVWDEGLRYLPSAYITKVGKIVQ